MILSSDPILHLDESWMRRRVPITEILLDNGFPPHLTDTLANFIGVLTGTSSWLLQYYHREKYQKLPVIEYEWKTKHALLWKAKLIAQKDKLFTDVEFIFYTLRKDEKEFLYKKLLTLIEQDIIPPSIVPKRK